MIFAGIDPGLDGAIAIISPERIEIVDIPTLLVGNRREVSARAVVEILRNLRSHGKTLVGLERVHSMPKQGVASTFSFGRVYGTLIGALSALPLPYEMVTPQTWHKTMLAGMPKGKDSSIQRCHELFPDVFQACCPQCPPSEDADCITLKSHHNRADALLIAEHMRRTTGDVSE